MRRWGPASSGPEYSPMTDRAMRAFLDSCGSSGPLIIGVEDAWRLGHVLARPRPAVCHHRPRPGDGPLPARRGCEPTPRVFPNDRGAPLLASTWRAGPGRIGGRNPASGAGSTRAPAFGSGRSACVRGTKAPALRPTAKPVARTCRSRSHGRSNSPNSRRSSWRSSVGGPALRPGGPADP